MDSSSEPSEHAIPESPPPSPPLPPDINSSGQASLPPVKFRVWPSLVVVPATIVVVLMGQVCLGIGFALYYQFATTEGLTDFQTRLFSDVHFLTLSLLTNFTIIVAAALLGGWLSRQRLAPRLSMARPNWSLWMVPLVILGSMFMWAMVSAAMPLLFDESSAHLENVFAMLVNLGRSNPLLLILLIAILPAIVEELLMRGYVQSRLVRRMGPVLGIGLASIGFALLHMDPQHMLGVLPLGVWFGFVAWRTGSVYPAMLCHAVNNGCAVAMILMSVNGTNVATSHDPTLSDLTIWDMIPVSTPLFLAVTGAGFAAAVVALSLRKLPKD